MSQQIKHIYEFGPFQLNAAERLLVRGGKAIPLTPKAFDVLHYLVTHPDRLVTKDTLLDAVWPETAISEAVLRIAIGELRRALGDDARDVYRAGADCRGKIS